MKPSPCKGCEDKMVGCHSVCRSYKEWKEETHAESEWLKSHRVDMTEPARRRQIEWLKKNRGGKQRRVRDE